MKLSFFVPGLAVAQSRPRFARRGNFVTTYDAAPAKDYKGWVKSCAMEAMQRKGLSMVGRNIPMKLFVFISIVKPASAKKSILHPVKKPDCDNILKGLQDAMEGIVYEADQQIVDVHVSKRFDTAPGVQICVEVMQ